MTNDFLKLKQKQMSVKLQINQVPIVVFNDSVLSVSFLIHTGCY
jgi:hypothetical protein